MRNQFEFLFDAGEHLEITIIVQKQNLVLDAKLGDQAIVRAARRDAPPAATGVQLGSRDVGSGVAFGFEQGKCREVGAQPFETFRVRDIGVNDAFRPDLAIDPPDSAVTAFFAEHTAPYGMCLRR